MAVSLIVDYLHDDSVLLTVIEEEAGVSARQGDKGGSASRVAASVARRTARTRSLRQLCLYLGLLTLFLSTMMKIVTVTQVPLVVAVCRWLGHLPSVPAYVPLLLLAIALLLSVSLSQTTIAEHVTVTRGVGIGVARTNGWGGRVELGWADAEAVQRVLVAEAVYHLAIVTYAVCLVKASTDEQPPHPPPPATCHGTTPTSLVLFPSLLPPLPIVQRVTTIVRQALR
uniref:GPI-GlcNAc transferase complex PIG-H component conserved domain-containing protein n=1 Tax=Sexangularia sp. CB-2014 TaxID=1486929 RepID=A0A7S1VH83_9EUKA